MSNDGAIELEEAEVHVFRPFFTTKANNLGVGLSLARRIVKAHGGSLLLAANSPEEGTCFSLTLPASPFASTPPLPGATGEEAAAS